MNMITCNKKCRHQNQGYCGLNHIAQLTGSVGADGGKCGYFEPFGTAQASFEPPGYERADLKYKNMNDL